MLVLTAPTSSSGAAVAAVGAVSLRPSRMGRDQVMYVLPLGTSDKVTRQSSLMVSLGISGRGRRGRRRLDSHGVTRPSSPIHNDGGGFGFCWYDFYEGSQSNWILDVQRGLGCVYISSCFLTSLLACQVVMRHAGRCQAADRAMCLKFSFHMNMCHAGSCSTLPTYLSTYLGTFTSRSLFLSHPERTPEDPWDARA